MKKICFITTIPITLKAFVLKTAEYIHEYTDWEISMISNYDEEFASMLPDYIHYYPVKMERGISIGGIKAMFEMRRIFKEEKFDLIQYSTPNASMYASLAGWMTGIPVRLYCQWGMAFVGFDGFKRTIFKCIEKTVCALSTWIEPDSYSNLKYAHDQGLYPAKKGSVIWNGSACGVDLKKFNIEQKELYRRKIREELQIPDDGFVYGFVGRITRDKGVNELLEAFRKLDDNSYLIMVGPDEIDQTINMELYNWSVANDRVIYTGYTNVVEQYLSAMDCYILPSYREGFGMGVVEAEAMGVPVIVTNIPGPIDAMSKDETGLIVEKKDVGSLFCAMNVMKNHPEQAKQLGLRASSYVKERFEQGRLFQFILNDRKALLKEN